MTTVVSPSLIEAQKEYEAEWWKHDYPSMRAIEKGYLVDGNVVRDDDVTTAEEKSHHPFYTVFRAAHGLGPVIAGSVSPSPSTTVFLSIQGRAGQPAFCDDAGLILERLMRHCKRALLMSCRLEDAQIGKGALEDALAKLGCGVLQFDETKKVTHLNRAAENMLGAHLRLSRGRLMPTEPNAAAALDAALTAALSPSEEARLQCAHPVLIARDDSQRALAAYVLPLRTEASAAVWSPLRLAHALVVVIDLGTSRSIDPALVRDYLGITLGEARIAAQIGAGQSPRATATRLGISEETVRTTLKRVFSKTGTSRQSELTALMSRLQLLPVASLGLEPPNEED